MTPTLLVRIWSWLRSHSWLLFPVPILVAAWAWRWARDRRRPDALGLTMTPDQADAARGRIQDARDRRMGEIETRWDDLREKWTKWNGQPKDRP